MLSEILLRQIETGNIFHSYILEGNKERTQQEWRAFATALLNSDIDISNLVEMIEPENNNIRIDQIRSFNKSVYEEPANSKYKVFVMEDAHFMRTESQNALLKTLEEMPSYSILLMTTDNKFKLLDTIISRSQIINLSSETSLDFDSELTKMVIELIIKACEGNYYIINKERNLIKELSTYRHETLYIMSKIFSDINNDEYHNSKYRELIKRLSVLNIKSLEKIVFKIETIKDYLKVNVNFQLALEDLIFTIIKEIREARMIYEAK